MPKLINKFIAFLGSGVFALTVAGLIILAAATGSFIPQGLMMFEYIRMYGRAFPFLINSGLIGVYQSWWFILLLGLLGLNLLFNALKHLKDWRAKYADIISHSSLLLILAGSGIDFLWPEKGLALVYAGFLFLNLGVILALYRGQNGSSAF